MNVSCDIKYQNMTCIGCGGAHTGIFSSLPLLLTPFSIFAPPTYSLESLLRGLISDHAWMLHALSRYVYYSKFVTASADLCHDLRSYFYNVKGLV